MRKVFLVLVMVLVMATTCFAANGSVRNLFDLETIATTASDSSIAVPVPSAGYFGIWYKATSTVGTPDIKLEVTMSYDTTSANFVEPESMSDIVTNLTDENAHVKSIQPPPMKFLKVKYTGNAANPADTVLTAYLFVQEGE